MTDSEGPTTEGVRPERVGTEGMGTERMGTEGLKTPSLSVDRGGDSEGRPGKESVGPSVAVDPELAGLMRHRRREARRHQAQMAQICRHPDPAEAASGLAQQRIWALQRARQRRLKLSDLAMVRRSS